MRRAPVLNQTGEPDYDAPFSGGMVFGQNIPSGRYWIKMTGNSGGPLLDARGRVIGVNAQIESQDGSSSGVGFSIPVNIVKRVAPVLIKDGKYNYAWLGITGTSLTLDLNEAMNLSSVDVVHTGGERGWPGDVPQVRLDCSRMAALGWRASLTSNEAVRRACRELAQEIA